MTFSPNMEPAIDITQQNWNDTVYDQLTDFDKSEVVDRCFG